MPASEIGKPEIREALDGCREDLHKAANVLAEKGHVEEAAAVRELTSSGDVHKVAGRSLKALSDLDERSRRLVWAAVDETANQKILNGENWDAGVLRLWCREVDTLFDVDG